MPLFGHHSPDKHQELPSSSVYHPTYACVTMNESDRLRFIQFSKEEVDALRNVIASAWPKGIQEERNYHGSWEFKLKGDPWDGQGGDAVPSRSLVCAVLAHLYQVGWVLVGAADASKKENDKDSLLFRRHGPSPPLTFFAISFNEDDKLRLIQAPPEMIPSFRQMLGPLLQDEHDKDGAWQFKLHSYPWCAEGAEAVSTRTLLLNILQTLETHGFRIYASIDQSSGSYDEKKTTSETDTWFVCRPFGWQQGAPVYSDFYSVAHSAPYGGSSTTYARTLPGGSPYGLEPVPGPSPYGASPGTPYGASLGPNPGYNPNPGYTPYSQE
jgi:hypothetical protein